MGPIGPKNAQTSVTDLSGADCKSDHCKSKPPRRSNLHARSNICTFTRFSGRNTSFELFVAFHLEVYLESHEGDLVLGPRGPISEAYGLKALWP